MCKCPAVARVGGGGGWAQLELTDALFWSIFDGVTVKTGNMGD